MKPGTKIEMRIISDARFLGDAKNLEALHGANVSSLKTGLHNSGIEIYETSKERFLNNWTDGSEPQIRQNFILVISKPMTQNQAYEIINPIQAQPLKFKKSSR